MGTHQAERPMIQGLRILALGCGGLVLAVIARALGAGVGEAFGLMFGFYIGELTMFYIGGTTR